MGLSRGTLNAVLLATTAGLAIGGAAGIVAPTFAEAGPAAPRHAAPPTVVTDVDVLGADHMSITIRFGNTGAVVRHVAPADLTVSAGPAVLRARTPTAVDILPGHVVTSTFAFDPPPPGADLTLHLPGETLPL
ncbi:hypothetical protein Daura_12170 [Dactylosporangium aurantiacum]|uniref:Uncharacterized protein n=1 Tax=Dactylosporangium aurantiacum TaxID=35754 RepID=A0A9Q9MJE9_9ACTN|nr:hypothetical protein [Dactylosporangium aurantiacum]MDG6104131.1 hypothetical protein [Dactylosporangium aurantiacum]UWZ56860.1 hypothetical protein Daura_12170 [Dactylosporangium aurantiacum]